MANYNVLTAAKPIGNRPYTSRGHNLRFFGAVIFESAWSLLDFGQKEQDKNLKL
jgi:hypothetical protein